MSQVTLKTKSAVAETLFIPLYARAAETQRSDALIRDEKAAALVKQLNFDFSRVKFQAHDQAAMILRLREFDRQARDFLTRHPEAVVVHLGCGLDTRFERVDNGQVEWYDLDLPEVIELRRQLIGGEGARYHHLACSVFDGAWLDIVSRHRQHPFLFLAEGVLVYFDVAQVKSLVLTLQERSPGAELVSDAMTPFMVRANNLQLAFSKVSARVRWGLRHARDLESWNGDICLLDEWYYLDHPEPRLGHLEWMRYFPPMVKAMGVFHYRLGRSTGQVSKLHHHS
jgi:O-methyltransferase involved in polyketide biosynthesis